MEHEEWYDKSSLLRHFSLPETDGFLFSFLFINHAQTEIFFNSL